MSELDELIDDMHDLSMELASMTAEREALLSRLAAVISSEKRCINLIKRIARLDPGASGEYAKTFLAQIGVKP